MVRKFREYPSQERLRELFDYREDGVLIHKSVTHYGKKQLVGTVAGTTNTTGYVRIGISGQMWQGHRLIWIFHKGSVPDGMQIDHINGIRNDNRIENLRLATQQQNILNVPVKRTSTTGLKGVHFEPRTGKFYSVIKINGKAKGLGTFVTAEEAHEAYVVAARQLHGEFMNCGERERSYPRN